MNQLRSTLWSRLATGLLILYWIGLTTGTHVPTLPVHLSQGGDKIAHFVAFAGLAFLLSWVWTTRRPFLPAGFFFALGVAALYGFLDEQTQQLVPGRSCELADWLADVLGALTGISLFWGLDLVYRRLLQVDGPIRSRVDKA